MGWEDRRGRSEVGEEREGRSGCFVDWWEEWEAGEREKGVLVRETGFGKV